MNEDFMSGFEKVAATRLGKMVAKGLGSTPKALSAGKGNFVPKLNAGGVKRNVQSFKANKVLKSSPGAQSVARGNAKSLYATGSKSPSAAKAMR